MRDSEQIFETDLSCKIWGNVTRANDMASIAYCTQYTQFKGVNFYLLSQVLSTLSKLMGSCTVYLKDIQLNLNKKARVVRDSISTGTDNQNSERPHIFYIQFRGRLYYINVFK